MANSAIARPAQRPGPLGLVWKVVQKVHLLGAVLVLAFVGKMLMVTGSTGFEPARQSYPIMEWDGDLNADFVLGAWRRPRGKLMAVWGLFDYRLKMPLNAEHPVIVMLNKLANSGVQLRMCLTEAEQPARGFLPRNVQYFDDPALAAQGCNAVMQIHHQAPFDNLDLSAIALTMPGYLYFDVAHQILPYTVDAAGLQYMAVGQAQGPPWLDPDLHVYVDHLRQKTADGDGILLLPVTAPSTVAGRARWFLQLNYHLFPRRFYLYQPHGASGASVQFRKWVLDYKKEDRWAGRSRWEPETRELSQIGGVGAARALVADEIQAIQDYDVQWVTFFTMNSDFRLQDWETVSAAEAIERSR